MLSRLILTTGLLIVWGTLPAQAAPIPDAVRTELAALASDIAKIIQKRGGGAVAVGEFTGSVKLVGHAGPGVQLVLAEELQKSGVTVDNENFTFEVSGRYQEFHDTQENREIVVKNSENQAETRKEFPPSNATNLHTVKLVALLVDSRTGDFLAERPTGRLIFGSEAVPNLLGLNMSIPPLRDPQDLSKQFGDALKQPQVVVAGTKVTGKSRDYAVEVLAKSGHGYAPRGMTTTEKGLPFVQLHEKTVYAVRLMNQSDHQAAVDLRIDGINCFAFSESNSKYWIIPPGQSLDVIGWHKNDDTSVEFKVVGDFPDTAAAKLNLKPSQKIGLISVGFSACWEKDSERPADEPALEGRGTGFGNEVKLKTKKVRRTIGQLRDTITVRYER